MVSNKRRIDELEKKVTSRPTTSGVPPRQPANIIEFATSPEFLGLKLFPRQATVLKIATLAGDLLTAYDRAVIAEWESGFSLVVDGNKTCWSGSEGTPGDLLERIAWCRASDRPWFREILLVLGRRGSKNFLAAILGLWTIWRLLGYGDPQRHYGIPAGERLVIPVFATTQEQATRNMFGDLKGLILEAACFAPFIASTSTTSVMLCTPRQLSRGAAPGPARALIEIRAAETIASGARGPASPVVFFDEFAHAVGAGATSSSVELYDAASPAQAQFAGDALTVQTSSPWDREGQLYASLERACQASEDGTAANPDFFALQLPSWELYRDADLAPTLAMWPDGPAFAPPGPPKIEHNEALARLEDANPDAFAVEYRAQWRASQYAYLAPSFVERVFAPYSGHPLTMQTLGTPNHVYAAHGDPAVCQHNFSYAIGHLEADQDGIPHVLFDHLHVWRPEDFPDRIIDYRQIEDEIFHTLTQFPIEHLTFDHFNSAAMIQRLQARANHARLPRRTTVAERRATATSNFDRWEVLKTAIGHDLIHAPDHGLARAELEALQVIAGKVRAPDTGPVRTDDLAVAMANVVWTLIGSDASALFAQLAQLPLLASPGLPQHLSPDQYVFEQLAGVGRQSRSRALRQSAPYVARRIRR